MTQVVERPPDTAGPREGAPPPPIPRRPGPPPVAPPRETAEVRERPRYGRPATAVALAMLSMAVMMGGSFTGWEPRAFAGAAGVLGVLLALYTARSRHLLFAIAVSFAAIVVIGLLATLTAGVESPAELRDALGRAHGEGRSIPTPLPFLVEWRFLVAVVAAGIAYSAAWLATNLKRPRLGLLLPLPIVVLSAIALPESDQTPSAIAAFALYTAGVAVLYRDTGPDSGLRLGWSFELRRSIRALAVVGLVAAALVGLDRTDALFPSPAYDTTHSAQRPHSTAATDTPDRLLFTVQSALRGPWRTGVLDSYDGTDWRLPPAADAQTTTVGTSGDLDSHLPAVVRAHFTVDGAEGTTMPTPTRAAKLSQASAALAYDRASGTIRLRPGEVGRGLSYTVLYAPVPTSDEVTTADVDRSDHADVDAPEVPPEVARLLRNAPRSGWQRADYTRLQLLGKVVLKGAGQPGSVPPSRVVAMLTTPNGTASPYELVAAEALLERWAGIPARIGFGYETGDRRADGSAEIHPRNAATWLEVRLAGIGWVPVTGGPVRVTPTIGERSEGSSSEPAVPGPDIAVNLFVPLDETTPVPDYEQIRPVVLLAAAIAALVASVYYLWPLPWKAMRRWRRRLWARRAGNAARICVAYAEFRDTAIDFGDRAMSDPPLYFLDRVAPDLEHTELAWLVTRILWGDLDADAEDVLAARAMSRSLRRRFARGQPAIMRAIAALSRQSLRHPYWARLDREALREAA